MHISVFKTRYVGNKCLLVYYSSTSNYFKIYAVCNPILSTNSQYFLCGCHVLLGTLKMTRLGHSPFCLLDNLRERFLSTNLYRLWQTSFRTLGNPLVLCEITPPQPRLLGKGSPECSELTSVSKYGHGRIFVKSIVRQYYQQFREAEAWRVAINSLLTLPTKRYSTAYTLRHASWQTKQRTIALMSTSHCAPNTHSVT